MATLLYRLGKFAARKRWFFLVGWILALAAIAGSAVAFMGTLSNTFSLPGTETQRSLDQMEKELPDLAGGNGSVVFEAQDGALSPAARKTISTSLAELKKEGLVKDAIDPFSMQETIDGAEAKVADGKTEIEKNQATLDDGKKQLADGEKQLAEGKKQLAAGREKLANGRQELESKEPQLADAKRQLDDGAAQLAAGKRELAKGQAQYQSGAKKLQDGKAQFSAAESQLAAGQKKYDAGAAQLADGKSQLAAGQKKLDASKPQLAEGQAQVDAGQKQIDAAKPALAKGQAEVDAGKKQLQAAQAKLDTGKKELAAQRDAFEKQTANLPSAAALKESQAKLDAGYSQLYAQVGASDRAGLDAAIAGLTAQGEAGDAQAAAQASALSGALASLDANAEQLKQAQAGRTQADAAEAKLDAAQRQLDDGQTTIDANAAKLEAGQKKVDEGKAELQTNQAKLEAGQKKVDEGKAQLAQGQKQLDANAAQLPAAQRQLDAAKAQLSDGRSQLEAKRPELAAGQAQLDSAKAKLDSGAQAIKNNEAKLTDGQAKYRDGAAQLAAGKAQLTAGEQELAANEKKIADAEKALPEQKAKLADGEKKLAEARVQLALGERNAAATQGMRFVTEDGTTATARLTFEGQAEAMTAEQRQGIQDTLNRVSADGVKVLYSKEIVSDLNSFFGPGEAIGMIIAAIVLFVMMGTFVGAGLPLLMAVVGVAAGVGGTMAFSSLIDMASITPALALMLGLAVGIDYTLFIMHRHRKQLLDGMEVEESIGRAVGTSGNAVVFAGLTVIIALAALVVPGLPFLAVLGVSAAATVALSVLVSLTLTPALLGFIGRGIVSKRAQRKADARHAAIAAGDIDPVAEEERRSRKGWGALTSRYPWVFAAASVLLLAIVAIPTSSMRTALPDGGQEAYGSSAQQAYTVTAERFGGGYNGPLIGLVTLPEGLSEDDATNKMLDVADLIRPQEGVVAVVPATVNDARTVGAVQIIPADGPASESTEQVVHHLRDLAPQIEEKTGAHVAITGQVSAQIDVSEKLADALPLYLIIVVGLSLVLLLLVFRSIVVPLLATAGFLLSLAAAFGATVAVYQWGWLGPMFDVHATGPIMSFLPILLTGILFGLAMDYQVFLVSGMREAYAHGADPRDAVRHGFKASAPVVTAAALIMTSVFAGFIFSHLAMVRPIGFALAVGVLADAFVVRMTLTPAIMTLLGKHAWYIPKWLDRILPDVDVEGATLRPAGPGAHDAAGDAASADEDVLADADESTRDGGLSDELLGGRGGGANAGSGR